MKGSFRCVFTALTYIVVFAGMFVIVLALMASRKGDPLVAAAVLVTMAVVIPAGLLLGNIPCTYSANELGFTITVLGKRRHYRYSDVESVSCEYSAPDRYGNAYVDLTVRMRSGETDCYTENCGIKMHDILNDPRCEKPQLIQLSDYVNSVRQQQ